MARKEKGLTYRQIYAGHEARMWLTQVIIPAGAILAFCPELREYLGDQAKAGVTKIKNGVKKITEKVRRK